MAQDIEARSTGNSALVIGLVAVVLAIAIGAFLFMRPSGDTTTVIDRTVPASSTTIVQPVAPSTTTDSSPNVSNAGSTGTTSTSSTTSVAPSDSAPVTSGSTTTTTTTTKTGQ